MAQDLCVVYLIYIYITSCMNLKTFGGDMNSRWYWSVELEDQRVVALPSVMAVVVERMVCSHRRARKTLWDNKPNGWEKKLSEANNRVQTIVLNRAKSCVARNAFVKKHTQVVNGLLEFMDKSGKGFELVRLSFEVHSEQDPAGPGTYFIWSKNYPRRALRCVSAEAQRNGFDLLREAYEGRILQTNLIFQTHEIGVVLLSLFFWF